jgi:hypothetical protein
MENCEEIAGFSARLVAWSGLMMSECTCSGVSSAAALPVRMVISVAPKECPV